MTAVEEFKGRETYKTEVAGVKLELPLRKVGEDTYIASNHIVVLGKDAEFTERAGEAIANELKDKKFDYLVTAEAKSLPLTHVIARELDLEGVAVARKSIKSYMKEPLGVKTSSITTKEDQKLVFDLVDKEKVEDKSVCLFDDVVTTGGTMKSLEKLVSKAGGKVVERAAIWVEGSNPYHENITYLSKLPVFKK